MFLRVIEWLSVFAVILFAATQLVIPAWRGQKLFPAFRKQGELESELADAVQGQEEAQLKAAIKKVKSRKPKSTQTEKD